VTFEELLNMALIDLRLATSKETLSKVQALDRLNDFAIEQSSKGGNVAIIVDEAQNLDRRAMENLRLLSNMETRKQKLIQIVLTGQPELEAKLNQPALRQLAQRISLKRYVTPLTEKEVHEYIQHRLAIANCDDQDLFNVRAKQLAWEFSGGVPRKINILCDNALLIGFGLKEKRIKGHIVEEAIKDLSWGPSSGVVKSQPTFPMEEKESKLRAIASRLKLTPATSILIAACLVFFVLGLLFGTSWLKPRDKESVPAANAVQDKITKKASDDNRVEDKVSSQSRTDNKVPSMSKADEALSMSKADEALSLLKGTAQPDAQAQSSANAEEGIASEVELASVPKEKIESIPGVTLEKVKENVKTVGKEDKQSWKSVTVRSGDSFSKLVASVYGRATHNHINQVLKHNPQIENANSIEVGQKIIFPPPYSAE
jgi:general secretion pathway protein A